MSSLHLGIVVASESSWPVALGLAAAALHRGAEVRIFAMADAVQPRLLTRHQQQILEIAERGAAIALCATSMDRYASSPPASTTLASQLDHAELLVWSNHLVPLT
jgi:sulfur relay (sulfurtransferase) complex TusBCD TusD component (DsrE family)